MTFEQELQRIKKDFTETEDRWDQWIRTNPELKDALGKKNMPKIGEIAQGLKHGGVSSLGRFKSLKQFE